MIKFSVKKGCLGLFLGCILGISMVTPSFATEEVDNREIIWVTVKEKSLLMSEMRAFLSASQQILEANLLGDMKAVEEAARLVGVRLFKNTPEDLQKKLPITFTLIGPQAYIGFESIVEEATGEGDATTIFLHLAQLQKNCVMCHEIFRFEVEENKEKP